MPVRVITREMERGAGGSGTSVGTGGMATKLAAAKKVAKSGVAAIVFAGKVNGDLGRVVARSRWARSLPFRRIHDFDIY